MTQLRKPLIALAAALAALIAVLILNNRAEGPSGSTIAEQAAPGPRG